MIPGVLGPMIIGALPPWPCSSTTMVSRTGTCSGMATSSLIPASSASRAAAPRKNLGRDEHGMDIFAPVASTASLMVLYIGMESSNFCPPLPGVTPATMFVPYATMFLVCREPYAPVMPWTITPLFSTVLIHSGTSLQYLKYRASSPVRLRDGRRVDCVFEPSQISWSLESYKHLAGLVRLGALQPWRRPARRSGPVMRMPCRNASATTVVLTIPAIQVDQVSLDAVTHLAYQRIAPHRRTW